MKGKDLRGHPPDCGVFLAMTLSGLLVMLCERGAVNRGPFCALVPPVTHRPRYSLGDVSMPTLTVVRWSE